MRKLFALSGLAAIGFAVASQLTATQPIVGKISPSLQSKMAEKSSELSALVIMKEQADLSGSRQLETKEEKGRFVYAKLSEAAGSQIELVNWLEQTKVKHQKFYIVNMIAIFDADSGILNDIAARDDVEKLISNNEFKALPELRKELVSDDFNKAVGVEQGVTSIGAKRVWDEFNIRGEGIVVAGQDTGIDWTHPALKSKYRGFSAKDEDADHRLNWHDAIHETMSSGSNPCGVNTEAPCDDNAHGTHTIGTAVGDDGEGNQIGVAPGAQWVGCRNMERGNGRPSTYIECFEWFLAPYPAGTDPILTGEPDAAPHVINNSWGCPPSEGCRDAEILPVLGAMKAAGIMVVVSAGNSGSSCETIKDPPAMHTAGSFTVGAHNHRDGSIASFSSRGPSAYDGEIGPDLTAPGVSIRSAVPGGDYEGGFWSGTSMAGPHVAGAVALLWSADPTLIGDIETTSAILRETATAKTSSQNCGGVSGSANPNNTYGHGHINIYKAVASRLER